MKRYKPVSIVLVVLLMVTMMTGCVNTTPSNNSTPSTPEVIFDAAQFPNWVETEGVWRTVNNGSFKEGAAYAPTPEDLASIMKLTSLTPTSRGFNDYLMVVLKDVDQQVDVVGEGNAHDGTVTVLVFGDRLLPKEESLGGHDQSLDRGYYNVGIATGYLNLGAISYGYGTHMFMTTEYTRGGSTRELTTEEVYLKDKGYKYVLGYDPLKRGDENRAVEAYGNLKFVCAVVIGTMDETAETKVTDKIYHENWVVAE
ncbi:hypothetical protein [Serpentinicella alkaliphila]|uniref:Uncharacterized protein n=1 Tax=Serpentinicella alkaliphila TaxID=1734049 RepID=A0A4R2SWS4_9FIRM|nr:hypothetical protein [Serpentinicella alkaliphila]QUH26387.1 hypothetical protein HZR23_12045 [Serpentinicella alkaliphila]TCP94937.1 hypothetical protein EDD79_10676 [Serpentinicella alkaliphila]